MSDTVCSNAAIGSIATKCSKRNSKTADIPIDTAKLVLARKNAGMRNSSVSIGDDGRLLPNGNEDAMYKIAIRRVRNSGDKELPDRAMKLKYCKGLKGCNFALCAEEVFGKLPKNLEGLCTTSEFKGVDT